MATRIVQCFCDRRMHSSSLFDLDSPSTYLSELQLTDCDINNNGCNGDLMDAAFVCIVAN